MKIKYAPLLSTAVLGLCLAGTASAEKLDLQGKTIVFMGDSITQFGFQKDAGYVRLVKKGLEANGINANCIGKGICGNKSKDMLARFDKDVVANKPDVVTLNAGVNDIWFRDETSTYDKYCENMTKMIEMAQGADAKVVLLTPTTVFGEGPNADIKQYADFLRAYAAEHKLPLADTEAAIRAIVDDPATPRLERSRGLKATSDGVHMSPVGNRAMARSVLTAFGLSQDELKKAEDAWNGLAECVLDPTLAAPLSTYEKIEKVADARKISIEEAYAAALRAGVEKFLAAPAAQDWDALAKRYAPPKGEADGADGTIVYAGDYFCTVEATSRSGLPRLLREAFAANGIQKAVRCDRLIRNNPPDIAERFDELLKDRKVSALVISSGSYDGFNPKYPEFPAAYKTIADKARAAQVPLILLTQRPAKMGKEKPLNEAIRPLNDPPAVRVLDAAKIFADELARRANPKGSETASGYALNPRVNVLLASELLPMLGLDEAAAAKAKERWLKMDDLADISASHKTDFATYDKLLAICAKMGIALSDAVAGSLALGIETLE